MSPMIGTSPYHCNEIGPIIGNHSHRTTDSMLKLMLSCGGE